ncbi:MAG: hypothetical protein NVSMB13_20250 [Mycobacteriales bacterium]
MAKLSPATPTQAGRAGVATLTIRGIGGLSTNQAARLASALARNCGRIRSK